MTTRTHLLESLAAASTNLAIATHFEHEKIREYDLIIEFIESGDIAPDTDQTPFIWRMDEAKRKRVEKWQVVDDLKAQLRERAEIAAALDTAKAEMRADRVERLELCDWFIRYAESCYDPNTTDPQRVAGNTFAAVTFARQIAAHV